MAKSIYINPTEAHTGKSLIMLGLMENILRTTQKAGIFRPIIKKRKHGKKDKDIEFILNHFKLNMEYEEAFALTEESLHNLEAKGRHGEALDQIISKYKALEEKMDFILIEGSDYESKNSIYEFNINLKIARTLGCPVIIVGRADNSSVVSELVNPIQMAIKGFTARGCQVLKVILNRVPKFIHEKLKEEFSSTLPIGLNKVDLIPENHILNSPTIAEVAEALGAKVLYGKNQLDRLAGYNTIAAMYPNNYLPRLKDNSLIITPGDRGDIIMTALQAHASTNYPALAGILLTSGVELDDAIVRLLDGLPDPLPILQVETNTYDTAYKLSKINSYVNFSNYKKIDLSLKIFEEYVDYKDLEERIQVWEVVEGITPKMFEYNLFKKAKSNKKRIVLPEGEDERILQAAEILLSRNLVDLVILGNPSYIKQEIAKMNLLINVNDIEIIDPVKSSHFLDYAFEFYEKRKHKGVNIDMAKDIISDATYFGTMMVQMGHADGMVSGAINTTQHTIRPALQVIKTQPGYSVVSSVFFMCLENRVLVYGDCAVNPNPTAKQLAEIALSSAETSMSFGIEPRIAMLSYSSGSSGKGEEVEKVRTASEMAKKQRPDLKIEGPIQYDAAVDFKVGQKKIPGSKVAGQANVLIFPDLNTGNNTYKAVQRETGAIAIGPVLQGLNKPVNDLSRGCTVIDVVNTVVITAIQAQNKK